DQLDSIQFGSVESIKQNFTNNKEKHVTVLSSPTKIEFAKVQGQMIYAYAEETEGDSLSTLSESEAIVLSGSHRSINSARQFIEPAIKQIRDIATYTNEKDIVWIITDSGYSDTDKNLMRDAVNQIRIVKNVTVTMLFATSKQQIIDHFNYGRDRSVVKISMLRVFSHGVKGELSLGLGTDESLSIGISDISYFNSSSFSPTFNTTFYSCNTGTEISEGRSFAQSWVNQTGGSALAATDGKTTYEFINKDRGTLWDLKDSMNIRIGINIDNTGCKYYPVLDPETPDVYWKTFNK
uniref:hypothetical protein n=1 Tax=Paenibacillus elgii TaxID=189691 RepID=UPI000248D7BB